MKTMSSLSDRSAEILKGDKLTAGIPGYTLRPRQIKMSRAVADAIEHGGVYVFEAGTGIGKSFAYLIPSFLSEGKVLISTATHTLQDQLAKKDIPTLLNALQLDSTLAVLKGRNNYLCLRKWNSGKFKIGFDTEFDSWAENTDDGDVSTLSEEIPNGVWRHFRADRTDCSGNSCVYRNDCHFFHARSIAKQADVLILNHHLLISGLQAKDILPGAGILVIDEGHRMEDAASDCLGISLSEGMLMPVFDGLAFCELEVEKKAHFLEQARRLSNAISNLMHGYSQTGVWHPSEHIEGIEEVLSVASEIADAVSDIEDLTSVHQTVLHIKQAASELTGISEEDFCTFVEVGGKRTVLHSVPLSVGKSLENIVYNSFSTTVLTSATLTAGGRFDFYTNRLGAFEADTECFGSPFDFASQGVLAIPRNLPEHDSHVELTSVMWHWGRKLAKVLNGGTMLLFTSYRNLQLVRKLAENDMPDSIELYVQGEMSRGAILDNFRKDPRAIILGTASFWEGVDLPGDILRAIIIDRLPFSSPGHPLIQARMEQIEKNGGSSFRQYSLPLAAVRLKQGTGRLIRSLDDTGAVMILDKRILSRNYGSVFLKTIQQFRIVESEDVIPFLREGNIHS